MDKKDDGRLGVGVGILLVIVGELREPWTVVWMRSAWVFRDLVVGTGVGVVWCMWEECRKEWITGVWGGYYSGK